MRPADFVHLACAACEGALVNLQSCARRTALRVVQDATLYATLYAMPYATP
jgi:hypothetical protein